MTVLGSTAGILAVLSVLAFTAKALKVESKRVDFDGLGQALAVAAVIAWVWRLA